MLTQEQINKINDEFLAVMKSLEEGHDTEQAHGLADDYLVEILYKLGLNEIATAYEQVDKWYA
ncbi:hypothetical protein [Myxosarcina sp. GI1(2024)]